MKQIFLLVTLFFLMISCASYEPFLSRKDKKEAARLVKSTLNLSDKQYQSIKKQDSILYYVNYAINKKLKKEKIEPQLNAYFDGKYDRKVLCGILHLHAEFPSYDFPIPTGKKLKNEDKFPEFNTTAEAIKYFRKMDSLLRNAKLRVEVVVDTLKTKKKNN